MIARRLYTVRCTLSPYKTTSSNRLRLYSSTRCELSFSLLILSYSFPRPLSSSFLPTWITLSPATLGVELYFHFTLRSILGGYIIIILVILLIVSTSLSLLIPSRHPSIYFVLYLSSINITQSHPTMSTDWSLDFCLVCDRQTSGGPYCSQTCRLAELDRTSGEDEQSFLNSREGASHSRSSTLDSTDSPSAHSLSASSSQTSLSSLRSHASNAALSGQLQDELRDYASCFDHVRDLKRRMASS